MDEHAIVVVDTTWLFRNLRKLLIETRTVNIFSGSGASSESAESCA